jgi:hypothetical protein
VSNDATDVETKDERHARALLARRIEFLMIGIGGVFIIFGWGFGQHEWARALGWICTGIGFAIEMVYGRVLKPAQKDAQNDARAAAPETTPEPTVEAVTRAPEESAS